MKILSITRFVLVLCCAAITAKSFGQGCYIDPTRPGPQVGNWYFCPPGASPGLGFPGNPNPIPLQEVIVKPEQRQDNGFLLFPAVPYNPSPGWSVFLPPAQGGNQPKTPCPGDPIRNASLAASNATNYAGGTFGYTRNGGTKLHDGTDILMAPNETLYSMYDGEVTDVNSSLEPDEYVKKSYGNYVEIKSTIDGEVVYLKYNHMNGIGKDIAVGTQVTQGQIIGISGTTGNAASPEVINKHTHIQAKDANRNRVDPEKYIKTKFDHATGKGTPPC